MTMTDTIPKAKIMLRDQIQADVDQYLAAGGMGEAAG